ncbi:hypothetical protein HPB52_001217 [Rhipicephalus sanguineus]|uniref:CCHC-type domain-containing protein n=1 Tax=Rhipicephalus sanguineus TaxID=34632 RepID=A0A9D4SZW0_RHISA|nr:hypothetical protein HPB52_001217 [Rhipicephalus sanguineus]
MVRWAMAFCFTLSDALCIKRFLLLSLSGRLVAWRPHSPASWAGSLAGAKSLRLGRHFFQPTSCRRVYSAGRGVLAPGAARNSRMTRKNALQEFPSRPPLLGCVDHDITSEEFISRVAERNPHLQLDTDKCKVRASFKERSGTSAFVAEVDPDAFARIMRQPRISVGWTSVRVTEDLHVATCTFCATYGHGRSSCPLRSEPARAVCTRCGTEGHLGTACTSAGMPASRPRGILPVSPSALCFLTESRDLGQEPIMAARNCSSPAVRGDNRGIVRVNFLQLNLDHAKRAFANLPETMKYLFSKPFKEAFGRLRQFRCLPSLVGSDGTVTSTHLESAALVLRTQIAVDDPTTDDAVHLPTRRSLSVRYAPTRNACRTSLQPAPHLPDTLTTRVHLRRCVVVPTQGPFRWGHLVPLDAQPPAAASVLQSRDSPVFKLHRRLLTPCRWRTLGLAGHIVAWCFSVDCVLHEASRLLQDNAAHYVMPYYLRQRVALIASRVATFFAMQRSYVSPAHKRVALLALTRAYRTTSTPALQVLLHAPPIDLEIERINTEFRLFTLRRHVAFGSLRLRPTWVADAHAHVPLHTSVPVAVPFVRLTSAQARAAARSAAGHLRCGLFVAAEFLAASPPEPVLLATAGFLMTAEATARPLLLLSPCLFLTLPSGVVRAFRRQARLLRSYLSVQLHKAFEPSVASCLLKKHLRLADHVTEHLWGIQLKHLRRRCAEARQKVSSSVCILKVLASLRIQPAAGACTVSRWQFAWEFSILCPTTARLCPTLYTLLQLSPPGTVHPPAAGWLKEVPPQSNLQEPRQRAASNKHERSCLLLAARCLGSCKIREKASLLRFLPSSLSGRVSIKVPGPSR